MTNEGLNGFLCFYTVNFHSIRLGQQFPILPLQLFSEMVWPAGRMAKSSIPAIRLATGVIPRLHVGSVAMKGALPSSICFIVGSAPASNSILHTSRQSSYAAGSGTVTLPQLIGSGRALGIILSCDDMDAKPAEKQRTVN